MPRRLRLALAAGGIGVAVVLLMVTAIRAASNYYYTLAQFRALPASRVHPFVQINGNLAGPIHWDPVAGVLQFTLVAPPGTPGSRSTAPLRVIYHGVEPNAFKPGITVVVAGTVGATGVFDARQVLVKCPSNYSATPPGQSGAQWNPPAPAAH